MKPFDSWSQMTRLGVALLLTSATLFALDVGGTFALDRGTEKAGRAVVPAPEQPVTARVAEPVREAQSTASIAQPQQLADMLPPVPVATPLQVATPLHVAAPPHIATPLRAAKPIHVATRLSVAKRGRIANVVAIAPQKPKAVVARTTQPRRVAALTRPLAPKAPPIHRVQVRAPQQVATLRDVRKYVMHVLASRYRGLSVISAATYTGDGGVVVDMVVHDRRREWFEKDIVHRAGTELSILSERQRTMGTLRPTPNLPHSKLT